jgi:hypothetical protein
MTNSQLLTDQDRELYQELAKRIQVAYISWRMGNKYMDYPYRTYANEIEPADGLIRIAKSLDKAAAGKTRRTPPRTKR